MHPLIKSRRSEILAPARRHGLKGVRALAELCSERMTPERTSVFPPGSFIRNRAGAASGQPSNALPDKPQPVFVDRVCHEDRVFCSTSALYRLRMRWVIGRSPVPIGLPSILATGVCAPNVPVRNASSAPYAS